MRWTFSVALALIALVALPLPVAATTQKPKNQSQKPSSTRGPAPGPEREEQLPSSLASKPQTRPKSTSTARSESKVEADSKREPESKPTSEAGSETGHQSALVAAAKSSSTKTKTKAKTRAPSTKAETEEPAMNGKIGFELQSNWAITRIGGNKKPDSKDVAYKGKYFRVEVDRGTRPELEIVTIPLENREQVDAANKEITEFVEKLVTRCQEGDGRFTMSGEGWQGETTIEGTSGFPPSFRVQYTEGVTLEKVPSLIQQEHQEAWKEMPEALKKENVKQPKLRGLKTAIWMYLHDARSFQREKASDDLKYAFTLMARTDFHSMYKSLSPEEKIAFQRDAAGEEFAGYEAEASVFAMLDDESGNLTVGEWLQSIVEGRDDDEPKDLMSPPHPLDLHGDVAAWNKKHPKDQKMPHAMGLSKLDHGNVLIELRNVASPLGQDLNRSLAALGKLIDGTATRNEGFAGNPESAEKAQDDNNGLRRSKRLSVSTRPEGDKKLKN